MQPESPKRILQVVGGMNRGGVETWLMHVLRHIDRDRFQIDFLVHTNQPCAYDDEIRTLGSRIIPCLSPSQPLRYARRLQHILEADGPYDVVHSHVHHYSGWVLAVARRAGVPIRIAHSHSDTSANQARAGMRRKMYLRAMQWLIHRHATNKLSASRKAAAALFGTGWESDARHQLLYYGIDLRPFQVPVDRAALRASLGIADDAFVLGHVGRFAEPKNHHFLVDIVAEVAKREPKAVALLVGDGPLRPAIEKKVAELGLADHVIFAGLRDDIPALMQGAMDVFVMPSLYEGLPIVGIEAQAACLPCVYSDVVPQEAAVVPDLLQPLSLSQSPADWADRIFECRKKASIIAQSEALHCVEQSRFTIEQSVRHLTRIYSE